MIRAILISFFIGCMITWTITYPRAYEAGVHYGDYQKGKAEGIEQTMNICYEMVNDTVDQLAVHCAEIIEDQERMDNADLYW